jgi:hypothetical protein
MAKVFGIHQLELKPDANAAEFERFVRDEYRAVPNLRGWQLSIAKGDRGENVGKYLFIGEIDSVETRNRDMPGDGTFSPEAQQWIADSAALDEKLNSFLTKAVGVETPFTDYVVIGN